MIDFLTLNLNHTVDVCLIGIVLEIFHVFIIIFNGLDEEIKLKFSVYNL
jgi:hypothetical protein